MSMHNRLNRSYVNCHQFNQSSMNNNETHLTSDRHVWNSFLSVLSGPVGTHAGIIVLEVNFSIAGQFIVKLNHQTDTCEFCLELIQ